VDTLVFFNVKLHVTDDNYKVHGLTRANRIIKSALHRKACYLLVICPVTRRSIPCQGNIISSKTLRHKKKKNILKVKSFSKYSSSFEFLSIANIALDGKREEVGSIERVFYEAAGN